MKNGKKTKYFSMFTGVGGFELGFERASYLSKTSWNESRRNKKEGSSGTNEGTMGTQQFTCIGFSEIDKYASELLKKKFPTIKNYGDATKINPNGLPDFDMLCGGFPCQAFSIAGKRKGFKDTRGTLFFEIARILKVKRPKIILLENVKGLLNHTAGHSFRIILQTLSELGYDVQWMVLNSKFFGVPQNRERVFIIGNLRETGRPEILPFRKSNKEFNTESMEGENSSTVTSTYWNGNKGTQIAVLTPDRENKRQNGRRFKEDGEPMFTLTGQDIHGVSIGAKEGIVIRKLTPLEFERLQGFPDNWTEGFSDTQRYKMIGNAVTVNVVEAIARKLI